MAAQHTPPPYTRYATTTASHRNGPRLVIGLDFGTTFSGFAWVSTNGEDEEALGLENIGIHGTWPVRNNPKVPSQRSYSKLPANVADPKPGQWGFDIVAGSTCVTWFKLGLGVQGAEQELAELGKMTSRISKFFTNSASVDAASKADLNDLSKTAAEVLDDYLNKMIHHCCTALRADGPEMMREFPVDIILTHPVNWPYTSMNTLYRTAINCFSPRLNLRNIHMRSEPEACALFVIRDMRDRGIPCVKGESFIFCDAGGGTIDLITYRIDKVEPLELAKVGVATGGDFGATVIDRAFLEWSKEHITNLSPSAGARSQRGTYVINALEKALLDNFESLKHGFDGTRGAHMTLPPGVELTREAIASNDHGMLRIPLSDMKKMFDQSVGPIRRMIQDQHNVSIGYRPLEQSNKTIVTNLIMAGGFSTNKYLYSEIKSWTDTIAGMELRRADSDPEDSWTAVAKGAVLCGLGYGMSPGPALHSSQFHLGLCASQKYQEHIHGGRGLRSFYHRDKYHKQELIEKRLQWLVRKGNMIPPSEGIHCTSRLQLRWSELDDKLKKDIVVHCIISAKDAPPLTEKDLEASERLKLLVKVEKLDGKKRDAVRRDGEEVGAFYTAHVKADFHVTNAAIHITVEHDRKEVAQPIHRPTDRLT